MNLDLWEEELDDYFKGEVNLETIRKIQQELKLDLPSIVKVTNGNYRLIPSSIYSWYNLFVM